MARLPVFLLLASIVFYAQSSFLNYNGPEVFCENRGCCDGRNDSCAVDFAATVCYCDKFCRKTRWPDGDCCPDYPRICEVGTIRGCYDKKYTQRYYDVNKSFVTNCNTCTCASLRRDQMDLMCTQWECMVDEETIREVNNGGRGWTAGNQTRFWGLKLEDGLNQWLGTNSSRRVMSQFGLQTDKRLDELPRSFDCRQRWSGIMVNQVADQNGCNASWAFSTASLLSDRWFIFSNESRRGPLSVHQLLECMLVRDQRGCNPGQLTKALTYIMKNGLVDAELYPDRGLGARASCLIKQRGLKYREVEVSSEGQRAPTKATVHRCGPSYRLDGQESIMADILDKGPVLATMRVLPELFVYRSGVYSCPREMRGSRLHTVKIVGWGEEYIRDRLVPYWIVANSWGRSWGEDGYMKIQRGVNTCHIEGFVISVTAHDEEPKGAMRRTRAARRRTLDRILKRLR